MDVIFALPRATVSARRTPAHIYLSVGGQYRWSWHITIASWRRDRAQYTRLVEREEGSMRQAPLMSTKPDAEIKAEAQQRVDQLLASQGTPAASQRPTTSAAAPAAPAWTAEHPLVPRPGHQEDIDSAPPGSVIQTPNGLMVKPQPQVTP
jgi:hypothetical protein